jgi:hypothetical protein
MGKLTNSRRKSSLDTKSPAGEDEAILLLKLSLAPALIAASTHVARRFGPRVGGVVVGLPLSSGPVALILALQAGPGFAAHLARGFLAGVACQAAFALAYTRLCGPRRGWRLATLTGTVAFVATGAVLAPVALAAPALLLCALASVGLALRLAPAAHVVPPRAPSRGDLPVRMLLATALLLGLTTLAPALGAAASGVLACFPLLVTLLAVFAHREEGAEAAIAIYRGFLVGLLSLTAFAATLAALLERLPVLGTFAIATAAALAIQGAALALSPRACASSPRSRPAT